MKKIAILISLSFFSFFASAQTLFTYGKIPVSKQEFLKAYSKNRTVNDPSDIEKYLDLYINFKLKVRAARDEKLDTLSSQKADLQNFKAQITPLYLLDENVLKNLCKEAFFRSLKELQISYLFSKDTLIENKIKTINKSLPVRELYNSLKANTDVQYADAGFITVFTLPYSLENLLYNLPLKTLSMPYKANGGSYFFYVTNSRNAIVDRVKTAQILISFSPEGGSTEEVNVRRKADTIYSLLKSGADFFDLAKKVSDDRTTSSAGGVMEEYGTGKYADSFYNNVLSIKNINDFSAPFKTEYGYHIVKLLSKNLIVTDANDEANKALIKQRVMEDSRIQLARDKFAEFAKGIIGLKASDKLDIKKLKVYTDTFLLTGKKIVVPDITDETNLYFINKKVLSVADWTKFLSDYKSSNNNISTSFFELQNHFINNIAIEEYSNHLSEFNVEYKQQLKEYEDGNLLFDEMEKMVWKKATEDSLGIIKYFNLNRSKYIWKHSTEAILIMCKDAATATLIKGDLQLNKSLGDLRKKYLDASFDSGRFENKQPGFLIPDMNNTVVQIDKINGENNSVIIKLLKKYPDNELKTFDESRGLVVTDLQNEIEEKWVTELKKKYPVVINKLVLRTIMNN